MMTLSAPAAMAALAMGTMKSRTPTPCEGSTMTADATSVEDRHGVEVEVKRVAVSKVRMRVRTT